jgi:hypothetical protein
LGGQLVRGPPSAEEREGLASAPINIKVPVRRKKNFFTGVNSFYGYNNRDNVAKITVVLSS